MNQPFTPPAVTGDKLLTSRGPDPDFYGAARSMFCPASTRLSEREAAARLFVSKAWGKSREEIERLRAEFERTLEAIDERWLHASAMNAQVRA